MTSNARTKCPAMNDLPNELLISIFEYLEIGHLIQCSLVCKRFKLLCHDVKVPELIISNTTNEIKDRWFFTNKQFDYQNAISVKRFNSYRSTFRLDKFRRLCFDGDSSEYAQLKLNEFTQLEQVEINFIYPEAGDVRHEFHINLPNLKVIKIYSLLHRHKFIITTPKLEMLKYDEFDSIVLTYVDTIKHLETGFYTESRHIMNNEEIPLIKHIRDLKLTTLSCNSSYFNQVEAIKKLVQEKRKLRRSLPKIYFLSVEIDGVKKIDEYENHHDAFLFQINNYNSLAETVSQDTFSDDGINYNQLMNTMKDKTPDDFLKKFSSSRKVRVNEKVENPEHLSRFLKIFDYLQELSLESDPLDQSFYSQLGELNQLNYLTVKDSLVPNLSCSKLTFSFDFLLKLKNLSKFHTNFDSPNIVDLALELLTKKFFWSMKFYFEGKEISICMKIPFVYNLSYDDCEKGKFDLNALVREVNAIRSGSNDVVPMS